MVVRLPDMTAEEADDFLKTKLRNGKGELHKVVVSLCQAKRMDHSILHEK